MKKKFKVFLCIGGPHNNERLTPAEAGKFYSRYSNAEGRTRNNYGWKKTTDRPSTVLIHSDVLFPLEAI